MRIITLTLNPAFDIHCNAENFRPYHESIVDVTSRDAGGKGVNISRALSAFNVKNTALTVVGNENGEEFCEMLRRDGLNVLPIFREGRIRENITLHEMNKPETRISFGGMSLDNDTLLSVVSALEAPYGDMIVTLTGSIPHGIDSSAVLSSLLQLRDGGAKIVIDSRSVTLDEISDFKPWLIKPNKDEIENYMGRQIDTLQDAAHIANELCGRGVENVLISLGEDGAVLATATGTLYAKAPAVSVLSTVGAGDSAVAGFIYGTSMGADPSDCLRYAVAFGSAACLQEGTKPPLRCDVMQLFELVEVMKIYS